MNKRLKTASVFDVCVSFQDGQSVSIGGICDDTTIEQLRQRICAESGRNVEELFDEGDEEVLIGSRSARQSGLSGSSRLIGVESGGRIVVAESVGIDCTDAQVEELCGTPAAASVGSLNLDNCALLTRNVVPCLLKLRYLREVSMCNCNLNGQLGVNLVTMVQECTALTSLDASHNDLSTVHLVAFALALADNTCVNAPSCVYS
jgi:hypothetical protein